MKNTLLTYEKFSSHNYIANDYTSKDFKNILTLPELQDTTFIDYVQLDENQTIEQVSYALYGTPDYWDVLILINNRDPLFDMVYSFDIIDDIAGDEVLKYLSNYSGMYRSDTFNRLKTITLHDLEIKNDNLRMLKIIKPDRMFDFIKIVNSLNLRNRTI